LHPGAGWGGSAAACGAALLAHLLLLLLLLLWAALRAALTAVKQCANALHPRLGTRRRAKRRAVLLPAAALGLLLLQLCLPHAQHGVVQQLQPGDGRGCRHGASPTAGAAVAACCYRWLRRLALLLLLLLLLLALPLLLLLLDELCCRLVQLAGEVAEHVCGLPVHQAQLLQRPHRRVPRQH
jgi:hypothetical protein